MPVSTAPPQPRPGTRRARRRGGRARPLLTVVLPLLVLVVVAGLVLRACTGSDGSDGSGGSSMDGAAPGGAGSAGSSPSAGAEASSEPTTLASYAAGAARAEARVRREAFCSDLPVDAVARALGGSVEDTAHYGNGDSAVVGGSRDVVHELGCTYLGDGSGSRQPRAQAWVLVPPVTERLAERLASSVVGGAGCTRLRTVPDLGPGRSIAATCVGDGRASVRMGALFGDAWLGCSVTRPAPSSASPSERRRTRADLVEAAGTWCVAAVAAAS